MCGSCGVGTLPRQATTDRKGILVPASASGAANNTTLSMPGPQVAPWLVDQFIESYLCWREEAAAVQRACERWGEVPVSDRAAAFAVYCATLDFEERAARMFDECAQRVFGP